ncbi:MAG: NUDIX domain-containing protein [Armatimonadetes bacterium]|nr:NUDIX domain-containing protein [Armatimonadota bacterium]
MIIPDNFSPFDSTEAAHVAQVREFVGRVAEPASRSTLEGHLTGSAFLLSADGASAWLIWHEKLQRWLQPGGHLEPEDTSPWHGALRELCEETGLTEADVESDGALFDVDVHPIPARGDEPMHFHHDLRFLFRVREGVEPATGRWIALTELEAFPEESLSRLARKVLAG